MLRPRPSVRVLCAIVAALAAVALVSACGTEDEPENGLIAFVTPAGSTYSAFVVEPDGSGRRPLTGSAQNEECVRWSPDGTRLALVAYETTGDVITGSWLEVVTEGGRLEWQVEASPTRCPSWAPDGQRIAFVTGEALTVVDVDGKGRRRLADDVAPRRDPAWSPDGAELAYVPTGHDDGRTGSLALTIVGADSGDKRLVPVSGLGGCPVGETLGDRAYRFGNDGSIAWAPGEEIVFALEGNAAGCGGLYAVAGDGSDGRRVNLDDQPAAFPASSPDASRIAYTAPENGSTGEPERFAIWSVASDGSDPAPLTEGAVRNYLPVWSPDGQEVAYLSVAGSGTDALYVVSVGGETPRLLEADVSQSGPSWQARP